MTIRYDDELEKMIDDLLRIYGENTKNKVIVKVIKEHEKIINRNHQQTEKIHALEARLKFLTDTIKQKIKADDMLARIDLSN